MLLFLFIVEGKEKAPFSTRFPFVFSSFGAQKTPRFRAGFQSQYL
jgi:hypothetical protein